jgi:hypothetical protein
MASAEHEFLLPRVEEPDLLSLVFEDVTDPAHIERWQTFARTNATLAREVLARVHATSRSNPDMQKKIIDELTYLYAALAAAALRLSNGRAPATVGDGGEGQQPSV